MRYLRLTVVTTRVAWGTLAVLLMLLDPGRTLAGDHPQARPTAPRRQAAAPSFIVHQRLEAEVREVDAAEGVLVLKTKAGRLRLHAAGPAMTSLRKGDSAMVDVALIQHPDPAGVPRGPEEPPPLIAQRLPASIRSIQRAVEVVTLNTSAGGIELAVPSAAIVGLHTGDSLWLELAVRSEGDPSALASAEHRRRNSGFTGLLFMLFGSGK